MAQPQPSRNLSNLETDEGFRLLFRELVNTSQEGIWVCGADGKIVFVSPRGAELLGYPREDIQGRSMLDFVDPEDHARVEARLKGLGSAAKETYELKFRHRGGQEVWTVASASSLFDQQGKFDGMLVMATDISDRKGSEDTLLMTQFAMERMTDAVYWIAPDSSLIYANSAASRTLGYSRVELLSMRLQQLFPEFSEQRFAETWAALKQSGRLAFEVEQRNKNGEILLVELSANYLEFNGREYSCVFARDISERKRAEEQFRQSQKMEAIGRLAGGVAHDFNNLLTVIEGYTQIAIDSLEPADPVRDDLEEIRKAAGRGSALTGQLLAFSRRQVIKPKLLDLNSLLADMDRILKRLIGEDIRLVTNFDAGLGKMKADPGQIGQLAMNLAVNARDAMPKGGVLTLETRNIHLGANRADARFQVLPGPYVMLSVSDTGVGMDPETKSHIFEPFFTTKEHGKGTGLGLSTVYGIVSQNGGDIWVETAPGHGTTFCVCFPQVAEADEPAEAPSRTDAPLQGKERILLVEDEDGVRNLVREILKSHGYTVLDAASGAQALVLSEQENDPIDLLVSDVVMPGMSGPDLAAHLAPLRPAMRVLFMSGYTDRALPMEPAMGAGTAFLQKPFAPEDLVRKVRELLDVKVERRAYSRSVLVVDDEDAVRHLLRRALEGAGYEVIEADNGRRAAAELEKKPVDLIITDIVMPEQEGLEMIRHVRGKHPHQKIIAISGAFGGQFLKAAGLLGANATLQKPINADVLLKTVERLLGG